MRVSVALSVLAAVSLSMVGCGSVDNDSARASGSGVCANTGASGDLLAEVCDAGKIRVATDPEFPPNSSLNEKTGEWEGFDIDVATEIAHRLGVEIEWVTPTWDVLTAGNWSGRWDVSVGSMTVTTSRQKVLHFTQPYSYAATAVAVHKDNTSVTDLSTDLDGADIGVTSGSTFEEYLNKKLKLPAESIKFLIDDARIHSYEQSGPALADLALSDGVRLDAVITSPPTTIQNYIDDGKPLKIVGDPLYYEPQGIAFDRGSPLDGASLLEATDKIVGEMHEDGTLTRLSEKWYDGFDVSVKK